MIDLLFLQRMDRQATQEADKFAREKWRDEQRANYEDRFGKRAYSRPKPHSANSKKTRPIDLDDIDGGETILAPYVNNRETRPMNDDLDLWPHERKHVRLGELRVWDSYKNVNLNSDFKEFSAYFTPGELADSQDHSLVIDVEFMAKIWALREQAGRPFVVNSYYRTPETNRMVGGHATSAHMVGRAMDIKADAVSALWICTQAIRHGFQGIGVKRPIGGVGYVHLDDIEREGGPVLWTYPS